VRQEPALYGKHDPRELPIYSVGDAAGYLHIPAATLRSWVAGRTYPTADGIGSFRPVISVPRAESGLLSFNNLVEAHVLRALRTRHGVPIRHVRPALSYAESELGIGRLLLSDEIQTSGGELFLEKFGQLINLSKSGQLAVKKLLEAHLKRVERDEAELPRRLYPFLTGELADGPRTIVIDPRVSFGRPTVAGTGISTAVLAQRIDAGETVADLANDYGMDSATIEEAIVYERAA